MSASAKSSGSSIARLLLLGVVFHALYILSIFDVYFQSTVGSSIRSANYTSSPPAKRVIIFTFDGCRVDKLFKVVARYADHYDLNPDSATNTIETSTDSRVPFLGDVMRNRGSWGISHNHAPTESRPCHVALTAGMYEDPHAVSNSWKRHPLPFDSVFNQSNNAFVFGNKDVAPILAAHAPQAKEKHYSAREEGDMVREDTTLLDVWAYRRVKELFAKGTEAKDLELYRKLHDDKLVVYCHFLGTDLTGPKYGADSREYLENIAVVDELIEKTYKMIEAYYGNDGQTAYVVNADHGMDLRGDHGDNAPAKTRTAIIAWGAGVQGPEATQKNGRNEFDIELPTRSRAEVQSRLQAQENEEQAAVREWRAVLGIKRKDVMQTDVAALISALAGLPYPRNSVGVLPFTYLRQDKYRVTAMRANAQQLYQHALRKEEVKRARRGLFFVPYSSLHNRVPDLEAHIDEAIDSLPEGTSHTIHDDAFRVVELLSQEMIDVCRLAIVYYQTYDWLFLRGSIVLGYIGWALVMTIAYLHPREFCLRWLMTHTISVTFVATVAAMMWWRLLADSPSMYYVYGLCPLVFWKFAWRHRHELLAVLPTRKNSGWKWIVQAALVLVCLELVVIGYKHRVAFSLLFKLVTPSFCWSASCLFIAIFPCLPIGNDEGTLLVHFGALLAVLLSGGPPVLIAMLTLQWTSTCLDDKATPPFFLVVLNWLLVILPVTWLLDESDLERQRTGQVTRVVVVRLLKIILALAPGFILLSTSYEVLFYLALCCGLISWVVVEAKETLTRGITASREVQRALILLLFVQVSFFGTTSVASLTSFQIPSTRQFLTQPAPSIAQALVVLKLMIPFVLVACAFRLILLLPSTAASTREKELRGTSLWLSSYFLPAVALADFLAVQFLFLVNNEGSWKQMGNSIAEFCIVNSQIVLLPTISFLAWFFVHDLEAVGKGYELIVEDEDEKDH
ncbi:GPI ethanolamine phosphate transferase, putative [Phytophthora infestans T30-4]|uniref:GPI ethanolamine phosphate transferase 1 n=1 Tax=Phytophthora infestans (strain T30-4) TaxID=403677 RepID=D0N0B2_PHYIT|nr:GPI ethanolamine phosphate transferase, putative [Phytophthora infestans T30-4]EEY65925.1 GPI ethanolamine phosphate transferase, putative [Phytophthora infestans T30-4]|eukprot:XP_002906524.1 GPI ethanolamine phosphate transferase, putative [Phytophthora infestans T30-4]